MKVVISGWVILLVSSTVWAAISPQIVASRTGGVAPLAVFFDSTGTVSDTTSRPFHELYYEWNFGDSTSGTFNLTDGKSKNEAKGPVAGHVFEQDGTYVVTMTVRDNTGQVATQSVTITVQDPDTVFAGANTICFANGTDFTGCPAGATQVTTSGLDGVTPSVAANRRFLLRRGDVFQRTTSRNGLQLNQPGPGIVGAFGSGSRPVIQVPDLEGAADSLPSVNDYAFNVSAQDWRIMDMYVEGVGSPNGNGEATAVRVAGFYTLVLRLQAVGTGRGVRNEGSSVNFLTMQDLDIGDSAETPSGANLIHGTQRGLALLGSYIHDHRGEHLLRSGDMIGAVISHCSWARPPSGRAVLKIHAPQWNGSNFSERILISENIIEGGTTPQVLGIAPQNQTAGVDERIRDAIVERNFFLPGATNINQVDLMISAADVTVRDNVFHRGSQRDCMFVGIKADEPPPERVHMYHNTCYGTGNIRLAEVLGTSTDVSAANNLIVGPNVWATSNLTVNVGNVTAASAAAAGFASSSPSGATDFMLTAVSPAVDDGNPIYRSLWDYSGAQRTDAAPDAGAWESLGPPDPLPPDRPRNLRMR